MQPAEASPTLNRLPGWASSLYERSPSGLEAAAKKCILLARPFVERRIPLRRLEGPSRIPGQAASVIVGGDSPVMEELLSLLFRDTPETESLGEVRLRSLPDALESLSTQADLILVRVDRLSAERHFDSGYLHVPDWVGAVLPVARSAEEVFRGTRTTETDLATIRRENLTAEFTTSVAECESFYYAMYLPYLQNRHGRFAVAFSPARIRRAVRRGGILWIRRGTTSAAHDSERDRLVSAAVVEHAGRTLKVLAGATARGDPELLKSGGLSALYYFSIEHAIKHGMRSLDLGGSRPYLSNGPLRYKRKLGAVLSARPVTDHDLVVRWNEVSEPLQHLLSHHPLLCRAGHRLAALTAESSRDERPSLPERCRELWLPGIERFVVLGRHKYSEHIKTAASHFLLRSCDRSDIAGVLKSVSSGTD